MIMTMMIHCYAALMTLAGLRWSAWYVRDLTVTLLMSTYFGVHIVESHTHIRMHTYTMAQIYEINAQNTDS